MTSMRKALHPINGRPGSQSPEGKSSLELISKPKSQLRVVDINRLVDDGCSGKRNESKYIKATNTAPEISKLHNLKVIIKEDTEGDRKCLKCSKRRDAESSKVEREKSETKERLEEDERLSVLETVKETPHEDEAKKGQQDLRQDSSYKKNTEQSTSEAYVQTEVTIRQDVHQLTADDLTSATVSAAYWRALANKFESQLDEEVCRNLRLFAHLDELRGEIETTERETEAVINFVKESIARGQSSNAQA